MRFLLDMPLSPKLAAWLTANGHDAIHARQVGLSQAADREVLQHASAEHRIIVTADLDFPAFWLCCHSVELASCCSEGVSIRRPSVLSG